MPCSISLFMFSMLTEEWELISNRLSEATKSKYEAQVI